MVIIIIQNVWPFERIYKNLPFSVKTSVEHVISHVVCSLCDDMRDVNFDNYVLKVHGLAEYLLPSVLAFDFSN